MDLVKKNKQRLEDWVRAVKHLKNDVVMLGRKKDVFDLLYISLFYPTVVVTAVCLNFNSRKIDVTSFVYFVHKSIIDY